MNPVRRTVNRVMLALVGLAMAAGGSVIALAGSSTRDSVPTWWPQPGSGAPLVDRERLADLRAHDWWTPAVVASAACVLLLALAWALAQLRGGGRTSVPMAGSVTLRPRVLAQVLARRTGAVPGVARARVALPAGRRRLRAGVHVTLEPGAAPATVLRELSEGPFAEARDAAAPHTVQVRVRIAARPHKSRRTR